MARQERAERTRRAVLDAAAREFARYGFAGTSLTRVSGAADVTMGALTFHFATKAELADAVHASGVRLTRRALVPHAGAQDMDDVARFTRTLVRLLEQEVAVRAAARLAWDRPGADGGWYEAWLALLHDRPRHPDGTLSGRGAPQAVVSLALCVVAGAETLLRLGGPPGGAPEPSPARHADLVWDLVAGPAPASRQG
ncbi:TetR family transcriptional regulator [Streptomyces sp. NPDC048191]|uniref:TetR family transcriptional regulator n=1 Tax=Streptomyces sp. NPDC048191 TaxID=3155484 RepID=UPI0033E9465E